ncbi:putative carbohydrate sulfotransferase 11 [Penaeus vannamei]|uniref:Carbohydrate sulfotransferase n=1 Tax=Penaeus vannamei TaxID=6689 RepID=A0A3R7SHP5_PENVA|nr:putative carbohydrate sulfotransferase 11 [Penaeus vannamei]
MLKLSLFEQSCPLLSIADLSINFQPPAAPSASVAMGFLNTRKNAYLFFLASTAVLIYTTQRDLVDLFVGGRAPYVLPKSSSPDVLQDLRQLKAKERTNVKNKLNRTNNVKGVRTSTPVLKLSYGAALRNIRRRHFEKPRGRDGGKGEGARPGRLHHLDEELPPPRPLQRGQPEDPQEYTEGEAGEEEVRFGATHNRVFELYPGPEDEAERSRVMQESVRVIIVRHPFVRLLSAYRDKMIKKNPIPVKFKFRELQKYIIAKYRGSNSTDNSSFPSFAEFVQHVIDSTEDYVTPKDWTDNVKCWLPYWVHCGVCSSDYNIIMKLESMKEDEQFLITLSRLEELKNVGSWVHLKGSSSADLAKEYYKDVTRRQMQELYQRYQQDFELFQYDIDDFLAIAKDE